MIELVDGVFQSAPFLMYLFYIMIAALSPTAAAAAKSLAAALWLMAWGDGANWLLKDACRYLWPDSAFGARPAGPRPAGAAYFSPWPGRSGTVHPWGMPSGHAHNAALIAAHLWYWHGVPAWVAAASACVVGAHRRRLNCHTWGQIAVGLGCGAFFGVVVGPWAPVPPSWG